MANLINLSSLHLSNNQLTGEIPPELANLTNLYSLHLSNNQLTGEIPPELGEIKPLSILQLQNNQLGGILPDNLSDRNWRSTSAPEVTVGGESISFVTDLGDNGISSIEIIDSDSISIAPNPNLANPPYIAKEIKLEVAPNESVSFNLSEYFGDLDNDQITSYSAADLPNGFTIDTNTGIITGQTATTGIYPVTVTATDDDGSVSTSFDINVYELINGVADIDYNALVELYNSTGGANWTDNTNWLTAADVAEWHGVTVVGNRVTEIALGNNQLIGNIPTEIGNFSSLQYLNLSNNQLTGEIPSELLSLDNLQYLSLENNDLAPGEIPVELASLSNLQQLYLGGNNFNGEIPVELASLSNLQQLHLDSNELTGDIPVELGNLTNLIGLNLDINQLTGEIPVELGNLSNLQSLFLFDNQLTGEIPNELGQIQSLDSLLLQNNLLSGVIPYNLRDTNRTWTDLNLENPPYVVSEIEDWVMATNNSSLDVSPYFGDLNNDTISYGAVGLPNGLSLDPDTGIISGQPNVSGSYDVTITATDDDGSVTDIFAITVTANTAPTVSGEIDLSTDEDTAITVTEADLLANASDLDGDTLTVANLVVTNGNVTLVDNDDGTWTIAPDNNWNGDADVSFDISDGTATITSNLNLTVNSVNDAPIINEPIPDTTLSVDSVFSYTVAETSFSDPEGDNLTYSATLSNNSSLPSWLTFDPETRTFSGTLESTEIIGQNIAPLPIVVTATDIGGKSVSDTFTITVTDIIGDNDDNDLTGSDTDDNITGNDGNDRIKGGKGKDRIIGDRGQDRINGEDGDDILDGGDDDDFLQGGKGNDDMTGGEGKDFLLGEGGQDIIRGNAGDDVLMGGDDDDILYGGAGSDRMGGFAGNDVFVLTFGDTGNIIYDYIDGTDRLGIELSTFANNTVADVFNNELTVTQNGSNTEIYSNSDSDLLATLYNVTATDITVDDFTSF